MKLSKMMVLLGMMALGVLTSLPADAKIAGISGRTTAGCGGSLCHSGGVVPTVAISGPTFVVAGSVKTYTITGTVPPGSINDKGCGVNIGTSLGTLSAGSNTKPLGTNEMVHDGIIPAPGGDRKSTRLNSSHQ